MTAIAGSAFYECTNLTRINIHQGITTLGNSCFHSSAISGDIDLPNLTSIGNYGVFASTNIKKIIDLGKITTTGVGGGQTQNGTFALCKQLTDVVLPNTLKTIEYDTFYGCELLQSVLFPESITEIDQRAFYNCTSLAIEDLSLPNLETLGRDAFYGVSIKKISNLGKITALPGASTSTQNLGRKDVLEEIVLPETLTKFPEQCFYEYVALKKCNIPSNVSHIPWNCFYKCSSLEGDFSFENTIHFNTNAFNGTNITSIYAPFATSFNNQSFIECSSLRSVIVGGTTFGTRVFESCRALECVELGNDVTSIDWAAFQNCVSLKYIKISTIAPPSLGAAVFVNTNNCPIYVPDASVTAYRGASVWSDYADRIRPLSEYAE